jgi:hypothetical protein
MIFLEELQLKERYPIFWLAPFQIHDYQKKILDIEKKEKYKIEISEKPLKNFHTNQILFYIEGNYK